MSVVIEELDAEVAPPPTAERPAERKPETEAPDERKVIETLLYEQWLQSRLIAD